MRKFDDDQTVTREPMSRLHRTIKGGQYHKLDDKGRTSHNDSKQKVRAMCDRRKCRRLKQAS